MIPDGDHFFYTITGSVFFLRHSMFAMSCITQAMAVTPIVISAAERMGAYSGSGLFWIIPHNAQIRTRPKNTFLRMKTTRIVMMAATIIMMRVQVSGPKSIPDPLHLVATRYMEMLAIVATLIQPK